MSKKALTPRDKRAAKFYMENGFNKAMACRQAGYPPKTAAQAACRLFKHPLMVEELQRLQKKLTALLR